MIDQARPMADLSEERAQRRAQLLEWRCDGVTSSGGPCRKVLVELDPDRPCFIRKTCHGCGKVHVWVEAFKPT